MKWAILSLAVLLLAASAAQAVTAVYPEISYPTATTWRLWLTECDWTGSTAGLTPSGFGIASFAYDVTGVLTATKMTPATVNLLDDQDPPTVIGQVGFPNGPGSALVTNGVAQAFAGQDTTVPQVIVKGFGVSAGTYVPPPGYTTSGPFSWAAPGAPGSANPGVLVFGGKRAAGSDVSIVWGDRAKANVFASGDPNSVSTVTVEIPNYPPPTYWLVVPPVVSATYDPVTGEVRMSNQEPVVESSGGYHSTSHLTSAKISSASSGLGQLGGVPTGWTDSRPDNLSSTSVLAMTNELIFTAPAGISQGQFDYLLDYSYQDVTGLGNWYTRSLQVPVTFIPEPASLILLALGALALRRCKR